MNHKHRLAIMTAGLLLSAGMAVNVTAQSGAVPAARAQDQQGEGRGRGRMGRPDLQLTAEQRAQLKAIHQSQREQVMALRNDQSLSPEQRMAKLRAIHEGTQTQVQGLLTPQQQETMKNARAARQEFRGARGAGRGEGAGRDMNFTTEQRTQLKSIHQATMDQVQAVRNDTTLSQEQKIAKLQSIHENTRQQLSSILTPEQQQQMKEGHRGGSGRGGRRFGRGRGHRGGFGPGRSGEPTGSSSTPAPTRL